MANTKSVKKTKVKEAGEDFKCPCCKDTGRDSDGVTPCSECGKKVE